MAIFQNRHDLFRSSDAADKLNLLQSLLDSKDLTSNQALALLTAIRNDLEQPQRGSSSTYRQYGAVIEALHKQMPEIYEQAVHAWQQRRRESPPVKRPVASLMTESVRAESEPGRGAESEGVEELRAEAEEQVPGGHPIANRIEPTSALEEKIGETEEEYEEPEEEKEEEEKEESEAKEEELEEEEMEKGEGEKEEQEEEKEEAEEEKKDEQTLEENEPEEKESEELGEGEESAVPEEEPELEAAEAESGEVEFEADETPEVEADESAESAEVGAETEAEAEPEGEGDRMATEAAEAAAEAERGEVEVEEAPEIGEEESPVEGAE
jgi:hypothetical protein